MNTFRKKQNFYNQQEKKLKKICWTLPTKKMFWTPSKKNLECKKNGPLTKKMILIPYKKNERTKKKKITPPQQNIS